MIHWHNVPRKQYVVKLAGKSEVKLNNGAKVRLHPRSLLLVVDITGQAHISRAVARDDRGSHLSRANLTEPTTPLKTDGS